jgi:hypothetical protein
MNHFRVSLIHSVGERKAHCVAHLAATVAGHLPQRNDRAAVRRVAIAYLISSLEFRYDLDVDDSRPDIHSDIPLHCCPYRVGQQRVRRKHTPPARKASAPLLYLAVPSRITVWLSSRQHNHRAPGFNRTNLGSAYRTDAGTRYHLNVLRLACTAYCVVTQVLRFEWVGAACGML